MSTYRCWCRWLNDRGAGRRKRQVRDEVACHQDVVAYYLVEVHRYKKVYIAAYGGPRRRRVVRLMVPTYGHSRCWWECGYGGRAAARVRRAVSVSGHVRGVHADLCPRANGRRDGAGFARRRVNARDNVDRWFRFVSRAACRGECGRQAANRARFCQDEGA